MAPREVWIFRIGSLGDALVALPALHRIRELHPGARLVLLTNKPDGTILSAWDILQHAGVLSRPVFYRPGSLLSTIGLLARLRRARPEALYYLAPTRRTPAQVRRDRLFFGVLGGVRTLIGLDRSEAPASPADVPVPKEADRLLQLVDPAADGASFGRGSLLQVPEASWREAAALLRAAGWRDGRPLIAFVAGSKMPAKRWPAERYEELGRGLLERFPDLFIVLLGSADEAELSGAVCAAWGGRAANLAGRTSLIQSAAILRHCLLYVGNDTGTMHLAAAMGIPSVALFSARDQAGKWEPFGERNRVLRVSIECAGCLKMVCVEKGMECLMRLSVGDARAAVLSFLDAEIPGAPRGGHRDA